MREKLKKGAVCAAGGVIAYFGYLGTGPFAAAYFAGAYMERAFRWLLFPIMILGMAYRFPTDQLVRYGMPMVIMMSIVDLVERNCRKCKRVVGYIIMGVSLLAMSVVRYYLGPQDGLTLLEGVVEAVLAVSASLLFGKGVAAFLAADNGRKRKEGSFYNREELILHGPGKDRLLAYADSFRNLAKSFSRLPSGDDTPGPVSEPILRKERLWHNRLLENRLVAAGQLSEMAQIITEVAEDIYDVTEVGEGLEKKIKKHLKNAGVGMKNILMIENKDRRMEIYLTVRVDRGKSLPTRELAKMVAEACGKRLIPAPESKNVIYRDYTTIFLEEDVNFRVLTGVARIAKEDEEISGDNYAFTEIGNSRLMVSLSDGMGTGRQANAESERVIELFEQFSEAGFSKEAAVQMISGAMITRADEQSVLSLDVSDIDLYNGVCEFLKIGSASTFIKRDNWVETVRSSTLPLGVFHKPDFDTVEKKLYDEDFIVMVTDGILDRIGGDEPEAVFSAMLEEVKGGNPREMAKKLLSMVMKAETGPVSDDMTILVAGIWKK